MINHNNMGNNINNQNNLNSLNMGNNMRNNNNLDE